MNILGVTVLKSVTQSSSLLIQRPSTLPLSWWYSSWHASTTLECFSHHYSQQCGICGVQRASTICVFYDALTSWAASGSCLLCYHQCFNVPGPETPDPLWCLDGSQHGVAAKDGGWFQFSEICRQVKSSRAAGWWSSWEHTKCRWLCVASSLASGKGCRSKWLPSIGIARGACAQWQSHNRCMGVSQTVRMTWKTEKGMLLQSSTHWTRPWHKFYVTF